MLKEMTNNECFLRSRLRGKQILDMAGKRKLDNEAILKYLAKTEFPARVQVLPGIFDHYFVAMAMPQGSRLREPINRALLKFSNSDDWRRLVERYIGSS